jgi:hypothetical protein
VEIKTKIQNKKKTKNKKQKEKEKFKLILCLFLIINPIQNICGLGLVVRTNVITCTCAAKFFFKLINEFFFKDNFIEKKKLNYTSF